LQSIGLLVRKFFITNLVGQVQRQL